MKKRFLLLFLAVAILIGLLTFLPVHGESELYERVLRLHVIASSDSEEDQSLKLTVRDEILKSCAPMLSGATSLREAQETISQKLDEIKRIASDTVRREGFDYSVEVELDTEGYPTKSYESCAFPAGEYLSLKIKIGDAEGKNWWCVLFPPLCLSAATDKDSFISAGLTDGQYQIITENDKPKYKIRFKLLESFSELVN